MRETIGLVISPSKFKSYECLHDFNYFE